MADDLLCRRPDRDEPRLVCGHPLPCPWHTVGFVILASGETEEELRQALEELEDEPPECRYRR